MDTVFIVLGHGVNYVGITFIVVGETCPIWFHLAALCKLRSHALIRMVKFLAVSLVTSTHLQVR